MCCCSHCKESGHCWHASDSWSDTYSTYTRQVCCHCGATRQVSAGHGPHKPWTPHWPPNTWVRGDSTATVSISSNESGDWVGSSTAEVQ